MSAKHTPGPWTIHPDGETVFAGAVRVANCTTKAVGLYEGERKANARLIAAAPELLDLVRAYSGTVEPVTLAKLDKLAHALLARIDGEGQ